MDNTAGYRAFYYLIWVARTAVLAFMITVAVVLDNGATESHRAEIRQQWQARLNDLSLKLQATILQNVQTVWGLAANVSVDPDITENEFQQLASVIFGLAPQLRNIGLAPDLTIRYIYPLEGNEAALGLDLSKRGLSDAQLLDLKASRRALFSGPIKLVQGGEGIAARIPIFENDTDRFWGLVSVILDLERLYNELGLRSLAESRELTIALTGNQSSDDGVFFGDADRQWQQPVTAQLNMPGISWTMSAQPTQGWPNHPESPVLIRCSLTLIVLLLTSGTFWLTSLLLRDYQMQRRFRGLFELAPFGIGLFDARTGKQLRANNSFEAMFGNEPASLAFFDNVYDPSGRVLPSSLDIRGRLQKHSRFSALEGSFPGPQGELIPVLLHGLILEAHHGEPVIWLIAEDISERKKADRVKSEFISTVSHELRTPLTSIAGSLGLLSNNAVGELPPDASRLASIAYRNTRQLTSLINDLLDIEKLVAGKVIFRLADCRIADVILECVEGIESFALDRRITVRTGELHDAVVNVDHARLRQALNNLLSNAIKFSFDESEVRVFTELSRAGIRICVRDQGPGIPTEFRDRIFQKFSQADASDRRLQSGTGLGLAITRELMHAMAGDVGFVSEEGHGACFWLDLPLATRHGKNSA